MKLMGKHYTLVPITQFSYCLLELSSSYSKQKIGCFIHFTIFPSTFPTAVFPIHFVQGGVQVAYG